MYIDSRLRPISNRADYSQIIYALDAAGDEIDLEAAAAEVVCEMRESECNRTTAFTVSLSGTQITISLPVATTRGLAIVEYEVGCTIKIDGVTYPFFVGTVPVIDWVIA